MRIRILAGMLGSKYSGSASYHYSLIKYLLSRGHQVSVVCFGGTLEGLEEADIFVLRDFEKQDTVFLWRFDSLLRYHHYSRELKLLNLPKTDFVIAGEHLLIKPHYMFYPKVPWFYIPHSYTVDHEIRNYQLDSFRTNLTSFLYRRLQRWALNNASATIRFTDEGVRVLNEVYRGNEAKFLVNPSGVVPPDLVEKNVIPGKINLIFVGRLVASKNVCELLKCLKKFTKYNWTLDIVGDGPQRDTLQNVAVSYGLSDRVYFRGYQEDVGCWYKNANLLISLSKIENFPLTYMEAMSYGIPTLSMRHDGVDFFNTTHEFLESGVDGFLASGIEDFCNKLHSIFSNPQQLICAGRKSREKIVCYYTWSKHLDRLENNISKFISD